MVGLMDDLKARQAKRIAEWVGALTLPGQRVEVRAFGPFASRVFTDVVDLAAYAASLSGRHQGVYWTPNPLGPVCAGKHGTACDADVISRRWWLIDTDPVRSPADTNSTDAEHRAALALRDSILSTLEARGFAGVVVADSGNGGHLMVPIDLPNDDASHALLHGALKLLHERFATPAVEIDRKVANAARVWKVPATLAMKGEHSEERPHRYARIERLPEDPHQHSATNVEALRKLVNEWGRGRKAFEHADDRGLLIRRAIAYLEKEPPAISGQHGHDRAYHTACVLVKGFGLSEGEAFAAIQPWNARCQPPWSERELRHKFDDAAKAEGPNGYLVGPRPQANGHANNGVAVQVPPPMPVNGEPPPMPEQLTLLASDVVPRRVEWLWPGRIPLGKLTTFAGVGGLGKTFAMLDIAARVSRGSEWPGCDGECAGQGDTLFVTGEDDPDDTLVPRLMELGADLSRVRFLKAEVCDRLTLADLPLLQRAIDESGPNLRLIEIDPPTAFLGGVNDHRNAELRGVLGPLKSLAAARRVAIIFNTHVNKAGGTGKGKVAAMMRVMGSVAWVNAVRAAHMFARDPDDDNRRIMACMKSNLGPEVKALAYRIEATKDLATIRWDGLVDITADDAINAEPVKKNRGTKAAEWMVEKFRERLEWPSDELMNDAKRSEGISRNAMFEAKAKLGVSGRYVIGPDGSKTFFWFVAKDWPQFDAANEAGEIEIPE